MNNSPINKNEIEQLLTRAQKGDIACLPELKSLLNANPALWETIGELGNQSETSFLQLFNQTDLLAQESIKLNLASLKARLEGDTPSPLEQLLVQRLAITYLQIHQADLDSATALKNGDNVASGYALRRLDSAQKRYLHAIKQLVLVRKLLKRGAKSNGNADGEKRPRGRPPQNNAQAAPENTSQKGPSLEEIHHLKAPRQIVAMMKS